MLDRHNKRSRLVDTLSMYRYMIMADNNGGDNETWAFEIVCGDGITVRVEEEDARKIIHKSDYFNNVFLHNTVESYTRTINKPDWSSETVNHLVHFLITGSTSVPVDSAEHVSSALDQVLCLDYRMCRLICLSFFRSDTLSQGRKMRIINSIDNGVKHPWTIQFRRQFKQDRWFYLSNRGVILIKEQPRLVDFSECKRLLRNSEIECPHEVDIIEQWGTVNNTPLSIYTLSTQVSSNLLLFILDGLRSSGQSGKPYRCWRDRKKMIEIHVKQEFTEFRKSALYERLSTVKGCQVYHTRDTIFHYFLQGGSCLTLVGSFRCLHECLSMIDNDELVSDCKQEPEIGGTPKLSYLILGRPTSCELSHMMDACSACNYLPNTLSFHVESTSVVAEKPIEDIRLMLQLLSQPGKSNDTDIERQFTFAEAYATFDMFSREQRIVDISESRRLIYTRKAIKRARLFL
jgi:hypothetical protein